MRIFRILPALLAFTLLLMTGCEKEIYEAEATESSIEGSNSTVNLKSSTGLTKTSLEKELTPKFEVNPEYQRFLKAATAVEESECDNTELDYWLGAEFANWDRNSFAQVAFVDMANLPTYHALVFENSSEDQYYGSEGEYTIALNKTFKDLKRFWDIQSNDLVMAAMHGNMLQDREKVVNTYLALYELPLAAAEFYADNVQFFLETSPEFRNGDHPYFTFNAYALDSFPYPPYGIDGVIPDKIIMGDGILDAYTGLGFEDVAPQTILAHEFGHHIQYQRNVFGDIRTAETTRRTELMADALAAYYLSHARGASMQWKRVQSFLKVFFNIGDCNFSSDSHHGTPLQRMAAAEWAYQLSDDAQKQGKILSSEEVISLFDENFPELINK